MVKEIHHTSREVDGEGEIGVGIGAKIIELVADHRNITLIIGDIMDPTLMAEKEDMTIAMHLIHLQEEGEAMIEVGAIMTEIDTREEEEDTAMIEILIAFEEIDVIEVFHVVVVDLEVEAIVTLVDLDLRQEATVEAEAEVLLLIVPDQEVGVLVDPEVEVTAVALVEAKSQVVAEGVHLVLLNRKEMLVRLKRIP
jgi:hypothetical protein